MTRKQVPRKQTARKSTFSKAQIDRPLEANNRNERTARILETKRSASNRGKKITYETKVKKPTRRFRPGTVALR